MPKSCSLRLLRSVAESITQPRYYKCITHNRQVYLTGRTECAGHATIEVALTTSPQAAFHKRDEVTGKINHFAPANCESPCVSEPRPAPSFWIDIGTENARV